MNKEDLSRLFQNEKIAEIQKLTATQLFYFVGIGILYVILFITGLLSAAYLTMNLVASSVYTWAKNKFCTKIEWE